MNIHLETYYFTKNKIRNNIFQNFEKAWSSLTTKQQNILKRTFLSEEKQTAKEIAKSLRIAESSVIDRKKKSFSILCKALSKTCAAIKAEERLHQNRARPQRASTKRAL